MAEQRVERVLPASLNPFYGSGPGRRYQPASARPGWTRWSVRTDRPLPSSRNVPLILGLTRWSLGRGTGRSGIDRCVTGSRLRVGGGPWSSPGGATRGGCSPFLGLSGHGGQDQPTSNTVRPGPPAEANQVVVARRCGGADCRGGRVDRGHCRRDRAGPGGVDRPAPGSVPVFPRCRRVGRGRRSRYLSPPGGDGIDLNRVGEVVGEVHAIAANRICGSGCRYPRCSDPLRARSSLRQTWRPTWRLALYS